MLLDSIINEVDPSWNEFISNKEVRLELKKIENNIGNEYYPDTKNVLRFLKNNLNNVKCIIVGMDPYLSETSEHIPYATGRSFEVYGYNNWTDTTRKSSINNILKSIYSINNENTISINEIREKIKDKSFNILPPNELFDNLEQQGVLFLNYGLTVSKNKSGSHLKYWSKFSLMLTKYILEHTKNVKWLLWGNDVQNIYCDIIPEENQLLNCHPRLSKFLNKNNFSKIDSIDFTGKKNKTRK